MRCLSLGRKKGVWEIDGAKHDLHVCHEKFRECFPQPGHPTGHSCVGCPLFVTLRIDVIVTTHNYGRFLDEALNSVDKQDKRVLGRVIVVDDASGPDDQAQAICERRGVQYLKTDFGAVHLARGAGFKLCESPLVHFLDADNTLSGDYLSEAARLFASDPKLCIAYPDLQYFGESDKLVQMPAFDMATLERGNFIDTGSVWRAEALRQVQPFVNDHQGHEDWWLARALMRSGRWTAAKLPVALNYRIHGSQLSRSRKGQSYFKLADLGSETVTIFTSFSKRLQRMPELWERRKEWLQLQTWPSVRLVVANTSHQPLPAGWMDGLPPLAGLSVYDHPVGTPGMEDIDRRASTIEADVQTAVAAIYNRMWQETQSEYVLVLEDDVFPNTANAIADLMSAVSASTAAVSGAYQQRYHPYGWTCWRKAAADGRPKLPTEPGRGIEQIAGAGFGCLLLRRSQVAHEVITGNTPYSRYYDADWFKRLEQQGRQVRINWNVICDHAGEKFPPPPDTPANPVAPPQEEWMPCSNLGEVIRTDKCEICGGEVGKGKPVTVRACSKFKECSSIRYRQLKQPHVCNMACRGLKALGLIQLALSPAASPVAVVG